MSRSDTTEPSNRCLKISCSSQREINHRGLYTAGLFAGRNDPSGLRGISPTYIGCVLFILELDLALEC
jgi:hypothetical protein